MKNAIKLVLCALLSGTMLVTPALAFYGDGPSDWARKEVRAAIDSGFPNWETEFVPWSSTWKDTYSENLYPEAIIRSQFCHLIGTILEKGKNLDPITLLNQAEEAGYHETFTDLNRVYWNYDAFLANSLGIIDGVSDTQFDPYGTLTREQAAKILAQTVKALRPALWKDGTDYMAGKSFCDQNDISSWAVNDIGFVIDMGLMSGMGDGSFAPQAAFSTEQAVVTCYSLCQKLNVPKMISSDKATQWLDTYRMNREVQFFADDYENDPNSGDISIYYGGYADGISKITVGKVTVDGVGELGKPHQTYGAEEGYPLSDYKAEVHVGAHDMQINTYYTIHVNLTLTMDNGKKMQMTDTFVYLY